MNNKKEVRGIAGDKGTAPAMAPQVSGLCPQPSGKKTYTEAEKIACSIEAIRNGEVCEACQ